MRGAGGGKTNRLEIEFNFFSFRFTLPSMNMSGENMPSYSIELSRIGEEEIFNKCLFKQISVHELKSEIVKRNISFSNSDSYHILTVKVKLDILEKSNVHPDVRNDLADEIASFSTSLRSQGSYKCCFSGCSYESKWHRRYVRHLEIHGTMNQKVSCQFKSCQRELTNVVMLRNHIKLCHKKPRSGLVYARQKQLVEQLVKIRCPLTSCQHQIVNTVADLKKHLKSHNDKAEMVCCPFALCNFEADVNGTLKSHFSRKHPLQQVENLKVDLVVDQICEADFSSSSVSLPVAEAFRDDEGDFVDEIDDYGDSDNEAPVDKGPEEEEEVFVKALAIVFNTWANVSGIPYSTVNQIVVEVFRSYNMGVDVTKQHLEKILAVENLDSVQIDAILNKIGTDDPFNKARDQLENGYKRSKFVKDSFDHVPPVSVRLNPKEELKAETYQYVNLKESLKLLLEDETFQNQKRTNPYSAENDVVKDVRDGVFFQQNPYFNENPQSVPILIFQDELEICNPLGSGKAKHKFNATYYTVLDVQSALRSKVKSIQLISLVNSKLWKKFGNKRCNNELLTDLLDLETNGVQVHVPERKVVKAALCYIVGDNLGLHQLAEHSSCFSSGYICRVCEVKYKDVCKNNLLYSKCEEGFDPEYFTEEKYDAFANLAVANDQPSEETRGIKGHCIFNILKSYHCSTGMPPCLGHDFFEGVFAYDVQHLLSFIINSEKKITSEEFNRKMGNFNLSHRDAKNRPNLFKTRKPNTKYEGSAGSLRVLSRIMIPILSHILDISKAGKMLIKLAEVSEIVTAPKLSVYEIESVMTEIITEYLDLRASAVTDLGMSNPRPKHHYLSHYSESYFNYGPLIMLWGMRMESKHVYFKTVIKASKNFKNVTKTCAERHQMAQVSYAYTGLFPRSKFDIPDDAVNVRVMKISSSDPFLLKFLESLNTNALVLKKIKIYGTLYIPGNVLVLEKVSPGTLKAGVIRAISFNNDVVCFGVSSFIVQQNRYNFYVTTQKVSEFEKVKYEDLQDYYPLQKFGNLDAFSTSLHHYISEK